jgi:RNA polymerase sigma factor (sigma-70 family)
VGRISISAPLLRLRSDEQLVALFRAGSDDAFRVIHDRYRQRLFAYARQMLAGSRQDAEDALQDVFLRAYGALRADKRPVSLRAWLYRVAHNRCIDQLRRPVPPVAELFESSRSPLQDPMAAAERREDLRKLIEDVRRLPEQQRSALLMRELEGLRYDELADALGVSLAAVKSLLVRARVGLVEASEARDAACGEIREDLALAFDRGVRASGRAKRHVRECDSCRAYRTGLRGVQRSLGALVPAGAGPLGLLAKLGLGGSGAAAGTSAAAGGGGGAAVLGGGTAALSATKVATIVCCAAVVTAGGAAEVKRQISKPASGSPSAARKAAAPPVRSFGGPTIAPVTVRAPVALPDPAVTKAVPGDTETMLVGEESPAPDVMSHEERATGGIAAPEEDALVVTDEALTPTDVTTEESTPAASEDAAPEQAPSAADESSSDTAGADSSHGADESGGGTGSGTPSGGSGR